MNSYPFLRVTDVCTCQFAGMAPIPSASNPRRCWRCGGLIPSVPAPEVDMQTRKHTPWLLPFGEGFTAGVAVAIFLSHLGLAGLALVLPFLLCAGIILYSHIKKEVEGDE